MICNLQSSAISLYFKTLNHSQDGATEAREHLINLIDSPGHIDFSSEVSTASRLCDGALVLVDAVEGVCSQTVTVLRQTWIDHLRPILVINKIDRLVLELKLTPQEAYHHLSRLLEQVNAVVGSFFASERMEQEVTAEMIEMDDEHLYFSPESNNVIFASAIDGWGFTISQFAVMYEKKLGMKRSALEKVLWGDYYFDAKAKKVLTGKALSKGSRGKDLKLFFVQFILEYIWAVYDNTVVNRDLEKTEKIVKALNIKILPRDLRSKDTRSLLTTIFGQWLPLSTSILITVINKIPSPVESQAERIPVILKSIPHSEMIDPTLKESMLKCDSLGPVAAYVSKMVAIPEDVLPQNKRSIDTIEDIKERTRIAREAAAKALLASQEKGGSQDEEPYEDNFLDDFEELKFSKSISERKKEHLIGFSRIYSGTLSVGQELLVLGPKYSPLHPEKHIEKVTITSLYLLMGRDLISLESVPSGNVVGIGGLGGKVLKNATLFSCQGGVNLAGVSTHLAPIVRVALEPTNPSEIPQLEYGLKLLNQADPCVQVFVQETGENVIVTAGELHLERCLKDLRERFAGIDITSSEPIVPYRESIVKADTMSAPRNAEQGLQRGFSICNVAGQVAIMISVKPLPVAVTEFLIAHKATIQTFLNADKKDNTKQAEIEIDDDDLVLDQKALSADSFQKQLEEIFATTDFSKESRSSLIDK